MHRPGSNPEDMQITDFLCDFCLRPWDGSFPMVEGHQGSLLCGECLTTCYTSIELKREATAPPGTQCTMCLEERDEPTWQSPKRPEAAICKRCCKQAAGRLHKDPDWEWSKPA